MTPKPPCLLLAAALSMAVCTAVFADPGSDLAKQRVQLTARLQDLRPETLAALPDEVDRYVSLKKESGRPSDAALVSRLKSEILLGQDVPKIKIDLTALLDESVPRVPSMSRPTVVPQAAPVAGLGAGAAVLKCAGAFDGAACRGSAPAAASSSAARRLTLAKPAAPPKLDAAVVPPAPAPPGALECMKALADDPRIASMCANHPTFAPLLAGLWDSIKQQFGTATGILMNVGFMLFGLVTAVMTGGVALILKLAGLIGMCWALWSIVKQLYGAISAYRSSKEGSVERFAALRQIGVAGGGALIMILMVLVGYGAGKTKPGAQAGKALESGMRGALNKTGLMGLADGANKIIPAPVLALLERLMGPAPKAETPKPAAPKAESPKYETVRAHPQVGSMGIEDWTVYQAKAGGKSVLVTVPNGAADASFLSQGARRVQFEADFTARTAARGPTPFTLNRVVSMGEGRVSEVFGKDVPVGVDPKTPIMVTEQVEGGVPLRSARETGRSVDPKQLSGVLGTLKEMGYSIPKDKVWDYVYQQPDGNLVLTSAGKLLKAGEPGFPEALAENGRTMKALAKFSTQGAEIAGSADRLGQWSRIYAAVKLGELPEAAADRAEFSHLAKDYVKGDASDAATLRLVRTFLANRLKSDYRDVAEAINGLPPEEARGLAPRLEKQGVPEELKSGAPSGRLLFLQRGAEINSKLAAEYAAGQRVGFGLDSGGKPKPFTRPFEENAWVEVMYVEKATLPRAFAGQNKFGNWFMASEKEIFSNEGRIYSPAEFQERYATPGAAPTGLGFFEITGVVYRGRGGAAYGHQGGPFQVLFRQPEVQNAARVVSERPLGEPKSKPAGTLSGAPSPSSDRKASAEPEPAPVAPVVQAPNTIQLLDRLAQMTPEEVARVQSNPSFAKTLASTGLDANNSSAPAAAEFRAAVKGNKMALIARLQTKWKSALLAKGSEAAAAEGFNPGEVLTHGTTLKGLLGMLVSGGIEATSSYKGMSGESPQVWGGQGLDAGAGYAAKRGLNAGQPAVLVLMHNSTLKVEASGESLNRTPLVDGDFVGAVIYDGEKTVVLGKQALQALARSAKTWQTGAVAEAHAGKMKEFTVWESVRDRLLPR